MFHLKIRRENKFFTEIHNLIIIVASLCTALEYKVKGSAEFKLGDYILLQGLSCKKNIRLPLFGPLESILANEQPSEIQILVEDAKPSTIVNPYELSGLEQTIEYIFSPFFISFYENNYSLASSLFGNNYEIWPNSWRMGWVVRNALSHDNKVFFKKMTIPPISWREVTVSPMNQKEPIYNIMNTTDILLLLLEMETDLSSK